MYQFKRPDLPKRVLALHCVKAKFYEKRKFKNNDRFSIDKPPLFHHGFGVFVQYILL